MAFFTSEDKTKLSNSLDDFLNSLTQSQRKEKEALLSKNAFNDLLVKINSPKKRNKQKIHSIYCINEICKKVMEEYPGADYITLKRELVVTGMNSLLKIMESVISTNSKNEITSLICGVFFALTVIINTPENDELLRNLRIHVRYMFSRIIDKLENKNIIKAVEDYFK